MFFLYVLSVTMVTKRWSMTDPVSTSESVAIKLISMKLVALNADSNITKEECVIYCVLSSPVEKKLQTSGKRNGGY